MSNSCKTSWGIWTRERERESNHLYMITTYNQLTHSHTHNYTTARFADVEPSEKEYPTGAAVAEGSNGPQTPFEMEGPKDFEFEPTSATGSEQEEEDEEEETSNWRSSKGEGESEEDASYDEDANGEGMSIEDAIKAGEKAADELDEQDEDLSDIAEDVLKLGGVVLQGSIHIAPMSTDVWESSPTNSMAMEKTIAKVLSENFVSLVGEGGDGKSGTLRFGFPVCTDSAVTDLETPFSKDNDDDDDEQESEELDEDENAAEDLAEDLGADEEDLESQTDVLRYEVTFAFQTATDDKNVFRDDLSVIFSQRVQCDLKDVDAEYEFVSSSDMEGNQDAKMFVLIRGAFRADPREIASSEDGVLQDLKKMGAPVVLDLEITLIGLPSEEEIEEEEEQEQDLIDDALSATGGEVSSTGGAASELGGEDEDEQKSNTLQEPHFESDKGDNTYKAPASTAFLEESVSRCSVPYEITWNAPVPSGIAEHARDVMISLESADLSSRYLKQIEALDSSSRLLNLQDRLEMSVDGSLSGIQEDEGKVKKVVEQKKKNPLELMKGYDELIVTLFVHGISASDLVYRKWKFGSMIERILADAQINANVEIKDVYSQVLNSNADCVKDPKKDSLAVQAEGDEFLQITENQLLRSREVPERCPPAVEATVLLRDVKVPRAKLVLKSTSEETWTEQAEKYQVLSEKEKEEIGDEDAFIIDSITHVDRAKALREIKEAEKKAAEEASKKAAEASSSSSSSVSGSSNSNDKDGVLSMRSISLAVLAVVVGTMGMLI